MNRKTIIIIGATSGIGKALFENYAKDEEIGDGSLFESVARNPLIHFEASYR